MAVNMTNEKRTETINAVTGLLQTPVQGNVMPILVCFLVMVGSLCGILYLQMTRAEHAIDRVDKSLTEVNYTLKSIETTLRSK